MKIGDRVRTGHGCPHPGEEGVIDDDDPEFGWFHFHVKFGDGSGDQYAKEELALVGDDSADEGTDLVGGWA